MNDMPIGVFDSGVGGLTVVREINRILPQESLIYIGDTARVPYGTRGKETITKFALEIVNTLLTKEVKALVVACNTISAICLDTIRSISSVPVIGVIEPSAKKIIKITKTKKIGIIGTRATIYSKAYEKAIKSLDKNIKIYTKACPLFVPIVEESLYNTDIAKLTAQRYLSSFHKTGIDTLHLGCTHYPLLRNTIQGVVGKNVKIIDSAEPVAEELKEMLNKQNLLSNNPPKHKFYFTDFSDRVVAIANQLLKRDISGEAAQIDLSINNVPS